MKQYMCDGCNKQINVMNDSYELKRKEGRISHSWGVEDNDKHFCSHDCISQWAGNSNKQPIQTIEVANTKNAKRIAEELYKHMKDNEKQLGRL